MMWLRLVPWVWERLELRLPYNYGKGWETPIFLRNLNAIADALRADTFLATSVKCFLFFLCPWVRANPCPLEVHDGAPPVDRTHYFSVPKMSKVPPKSPHARDKIDEVWIGDIPTQEGAQGCQTPPD